LYFARYFVVTRFDHLLNFFLHNNAIVGLLCSLLQCNIRVTNVTPWENGSLLYVVTNHVKAVAFGSQNTTSDQGR